MSRDRLRVVEQNLQLLREQQESAEREILLTTGLPRTQAEQRLRLDIKPKLQEFEQEYWQILASANDEPTIAESDAEVIVAEIVASVNQIEAKQAYPAELRSVLLELRDKLNQPQIPSVKKMKWVLSAMPPFVQVSGEGDLDVEKFTQTYFPTFSEWSKKWAKVLAKKL